MDDVLRSLLAALPGDLASFRRTAGSVSIDVWPALLDAAAGHGVLGVLAPYLDAEVLTEPISQALVRRNAVRALWHEHLVRTLDDLARLFAANGVRICALKGPALASRLYGDPTARSSVDLDLLVAPDDFERAHRALREQGYSSGSEATASYLLRHGHHLQFAKPGQVSIELHFQSYAGFGVTLPASFLMDRATPYAFGAHSLLVPSPEDEVVYLAAHAAGHYFGRLLWLCDLKFLIARSPQLDWDLAAERSRAAGLATAVGYAVKLLEEWLDVPLAGVRQKFPASGVRLMLADAMLSAASQASTKSPLDNLKGLVFTSMLCDRRASSFWLLRHHVLRSMRRRAHWVAPRLLPHSWSG